MEQKKAAVLVEENMKTIFIYAFSRIRHREDAEDLAGNIIAAILANAGKIRNDEAFYGYMWAIASNQYKKYLRQKVCRPADELDETVPFQEDFTEALAQTDEINRLRRELALLSQAYRQCTVAYYFDHLSCAEVAAKFGYSLEMVKYYLFKTRKLLKEGIGMERIFGEKSYHPSEFSFQTFYSGEDNQAYRMLFNRKLPGNILLSAYYSPMTIRELSIELGVATVYLEDEIEVLKNYGFLTTLPGGKYQTKLVIFTEAYEKELRLQAEALCIVEMSEILSAVRAKLPEIRRINFKGAEFEDNRLLWTLLWLMIRNGYGVYIDSCPQDKIGELYKGATGISYGTDYQKLDRYDCDCMASYNWYSKNYSDRWLSFAGLRILPEKNRINGSLSMEAGVCMDNVLAGKAKAEFPIFTEGELEAVTTVLQPEIQRLGTLYGELTARATALMQVHAPACVANQTEMIVRQTSLNRLVGLLAVCAVQSGELALPGAQETYIAALYGCYNK